MTLHDLQTNEALRQHEFPVTRQTVYLGHAGVCPLPRRVAEAVQQNAATATLGDQEEALRGSFFAETRAAAARLLGARPTEIAFVGPTTLGLSTIAAGLQLNRGDNIVIYFDDYPSNVYPWMALAEHGVEVRLLSVADLGQIREPDVLGQVDERTRLVALASCHFISGFRLDLPALGHQLRERGILFCVDAIQTLGAFPTTTEGVDFLAADAHKWLLGPTAAGLLYVRESAQEKLRPWAYGWHNVQCPDFIAQEEMILRRDARRYEAGSQNLLGLVGLRAALELVEELGIETIARDLTRKRARLVEGLQAKGCHLLNPTPAPAHTSGIVSFQPRNRDAAATHEQLTAAGVVASLRTERSGTHWVRFSPHYYNTDAELDHALAAVKG